MIQTEIIKELKKFSIKERLEIIEVTIHLLKEELQQIEQPINLLEKKQQLTAAAEILLTDYETDNELT